MNTIAKIIEICKEIGANIPLMLAIANVETGGKFNVDAGVKSNSTFVGLFQLSNGYGGCSGSDRTDIRKSAVCTWNQTESKKQSFVKEFGFWEDWLAYGIHQQGLSGFSYLWRNRNKKVADLSDENGISAENRRKAIKQNSPKTLNVVYVSDFLDYWKNRINKLMNEYNSGNFDKNTGLANTLQKHKKPLIISCAMLFALLVIRRFI